MPLCKSTDGRTQGISWYDILVTEEYIMMIHEEEKRWKVISIKSKKVTVIS